MNYANNYLQRQKIYPILAHSKQNDNNDIDNGVTKKKSEKTIT